MMLARVKHWVRAGGQALALAVIAYLLWAWAMQGPAGATGDSIVPAARARPASIAPPEPEPETEPHAAPDHALPVEPVPAPAPALPSRPSATPSNAHELRALAHQVRLTAEESGDFAELYERWSAETEDPAATQAATKWVEQRLREIELVPEAAFLSCKQSLCRLGLGFEQMAALQRLNEIELPPGLDPKISEVYEYPDAHTLALVIYWSAGALPPPENARER